MGSLSEEVCGSCILMWQNGAPQALATGTWYGAIIAAASESSEELRLESGKARFDRSLARDVPSCAYEKTTHLFAAAGIVVLDPKKEPDDGAKERPMPFRSLAAAELSEFLNVIAHPRRIQIIEELWTGEKDVDSLRQMVKITHSNASQHLAVLRTHRVVSERREGRRVFYRLCSSDFADWLLLGMNFVPAASLDTNEVADALRQAARMWRKRENSEDA